MKTRCKSQSLMVFTSIETHFSLRLEKTIQGNMFSIVELQQIKTFLQIALDESLNGDKVC